MRLARFVHRVVVGLPIAALLVAIGPLGAVAQNANVRSSSQGYALPNATAAVHGTKVRTKNGPLFHGQQLKWPKMPFSRSKSPVKTSVNAPQATARQASGYASARVPRPVQAGHPNSVAQQQRRQMLPVPSATTRSSVSSVMRGSPDPAYARTEGLITERTYEQTNGIHTGHAVSTPIVEAARPVDQPHRVATLPSLPAAASDSPANRLLAQAHELSATAQCEDDFSLIIETCRQASESQPSAATGEYANELASWALNRRGQLRAEAGRDEEAMTDFEQAVHADPERWRAIHNRGVLLAQAGEFEKAFDDFNRTIEINPNFAKAYSNRAALFVVAGNLTPALQDYARAIELDPKLAVAHRGRGRACHLVGRLDQAISHYDEAVRLTPDDAYAVASRADVLTDLGRYAEAAAEYDRAIEIDPNSSHAHSGSAWLLATCPDEAIRDSALAIERAQKAIELTGGEEAASYDTLAAAHANAGDFAAATQTVRQAVHLATADEREAFQDRLLMYQRAKPYRIAPVDQVQQVSYESY